MLYFTRKLEFISIILAIILAMIVGSGIQYCNLPFCNVIIKSLEQVPFLVNELIALS